MSKRLSRRCRKRPANTFLSSRRWQALRLVILARDGRTCYWCGGFADQVDHLVPVSHGGDWWDHSNLAACCGPCNRARPLTRSAHALSSSSRMVQRNNSFRRGPVAQSTQFFKGGVVEQRRPFAIYTHKDAYSPSNTEYSPAREPVSERNTRSGGFQTTQEAPGGSETSLITRDYSRRETERAG
jgi:hypothetical protein